MASGKRKISSLSVTYEEKYCHNWPKEDNNELEEGQCISLDQNTATVPAEACVPESACSHLQPGDLYEDSHLLVPQQQTYHYDSSSYPEPEYQQGNGYLPESQHLTATDYSHSQPAPVGPDHRACSGNRGRNTLYMLEDRLRHRVNVSIEDFRAQIQEVFYEQFGAYRESVDYEPAGSHLHYEEMEQSCDSVHTNQSSVDSGVSGVDVHDEQSVNHCLIKLQMCAAAITCSLQRAEYSVT